MNAVEFVFALFAVFGSTGLILAWTTFVYSLEKKKAKEERREHDRSLDILS